MNLKKWLKIYECEVLSIVFFFYHFYSTFMTKSNFMKKFVVFYLVPQIILLLRTKSSKGISLVYFSLHQNELFWQLKTKITFIEQWQQLFSFDFYSTLITIALNTTVIYLIIKFHKRRIILILEALVSIFFTVFCFTSRVYQRQQEIYWVFTSLYWSGLLIKDGSQNLNFTILIPKVFISLRKKYVSTRNTRGIRTTVLLSICIVQNIIKQLKKQQQQQKKLTWQQQNRQNSSYEDLDDDKIKIY